MCLRAASPSVAQCCALWDPRDVRRELSFSVHVPTNPAFFSLPGFQADTENADRGPKYHPDPDMSRPRFPTGSAIPLHRNFQCDRLHGISRPLAESTPAENSATEWWSRLAVQTTAEARSDSHGD